MIYVRLTLKYSNKSRGFSEPFETLNSIFDTPHCLVMLKRNSKLIYVQLLHHDEKLFQMSQYF